MIYQGIFQPCRQRPVVLTSETHTKPNTSSYIKAARRHFLSEIGQIHLRLVERLNHWPIALAAAVSELVTCVRFTCYFDGIIREQQATCLDQVCEAVFQWAMKRAQIWILDW